MANAVRHAAQKVVDAWLIPGVSPEYHAEWKARLSAPSEEGGWPVLARAVQELVAAVHEQQGKAPK